MKKLSTGLAQIQTRHSVKYSLGGLFIDFYWFQQKQRTTWIDIKHLLSYILSVCKVWDNLKSPVNYNKCFHVQYWITVELYAATVIWDNWQKFKHQRNSLIHDYLGEKQHRPLESSSELGQRWQLLGERHRAKDVAPWCNPRLLKLQKSHP